MLWRISMSDKQADKAAAGEDSADGKDTAKGKDTIKGKDSAKGKDTGKDKDSGQDLKNACDKLGEVPPGETNLLASKLWNISIAYYEDVKKQARMSFVAALTLAVAGTGILFWAVKLMIDNRVEGSQLSLVSGVIIQVISGIIFYLYSRTAKQLFTFHVCLERSNRFLLANTLCDNIDGSVNDEMRKELIRLIATAPLLSQKLLDNGEPFEPGGTAAGVKRGDAATVVASQEVSANGNSKERYEGEEAAVPVL
jgi:hypothetical protein